MSSSFIIIVQNEEQRIADIIRSVKLMTLDPILVIDKGSQDKTLEVANAIPGIKTMSMLNGSSIPALIGYLSQMQADESPEIQMARQAMERMKAGRKLEVFALAQDKTLAFMTCVALMHHARENSVDVQVLPGTPWNEDMMKIFGFPEGNKNPICIKLPDSLGEQHLFEWICRSVGFLGKKEDFKIVHHPCNRVNVTICAGPGKGIEWWKKVAETLGSRGIFIATPDDSTNFSIVTPIMDASRLYIGESIWMAHLAKLLEVPAIVFWNKDLKQVGWQDQDNRMIADNPDPVVFAEEIIRKLT